MTVYKLHSEPLRDEWLDAYGHLNEAYYLVPLSNASWPLQDQFGIGVDYFKRTGGAIYTVESHLRYLKEVRAPAQLDIESMILGADAKRIHFAHIMMVDGNECATFECMALHFGQQGRAHGALPRGRSNCPASRRSRRPARLGRPSHLPRQKIAGAA